MPFNATSCEVEDPWGGGPAAAQLDEELCGVLARGMSEYALSTLLSIWGLGSPLQPPA